MPWSWLPKIDQSEVNSSAGCCDHILFQEHHSIKSMLIPSLTQFSSRSLFLSRSQRALMHHNLANSMLRNPNWRLVLASHENFSLCADGMRSCPWLVDDMGSSSVTVISEGGGSIWPEIYVRIGSDTDN
jgi:hypothetical protein